MNPEKAYRRNRPTASYRREKAATKVPHALIQHEPELQTPKVLSLETQLPEAAKTTIPEQSTEHFSHNSDDQSLEGNDNSSPCVHEEAQPEVHEEAQPEVHEEVQPERQDEQEQGIPSPTLFRNFETHVAKFIWQGIERDVMKLHSHVSLLLSWTLDSDTTHDWRSLFRRSKLLMVRRASYKNPSKNLISAFIERWYPETNSFHFPFGEMTITLVDVHSLTGLSVDGLPVQFDGSDRRKGSEILQDLLGLTESDAIDAVGGTSGSSVKMTWLKERFMGLMDSEDDKSGSLVNCSWLEYTKDMKIFSDYAWGTAVLAFLYRQLGLASKYKVKQMGGYFTLLEAWIYEHFPTLVRPPSNINFTLGDPLATRWAPEGYAGADVLRVKYFRNRLDHMPAVDVKWNPYCSLRDVYPFKEVSYFYGCIVCDEVVEPYMPDRVLRQFGYVQTVPEPPLAARAKRGGRSSKRTKLVWGAMAEYFSTWDTHLLTPERRGNPAKLPWDTADGYVDWILANSHRYMSKPSIREQYLRETMPSTEHWQRNDAAHSQLNMLVERWKSDDTLTVDEIMQVVQIAMRTLKEPNQAVPSSQQNRGRVRGRGRLGA